MPHLIDAQPVFDIAERISGAITDPAAKRRFKSLLIGRLFEDADCARPLTPEEAAKLREDDYPFGAPQAFDPPRAKLMQARRHARLVRDALAERDLLRTLAAPLDPRNDKTLREAEEWTRKMGRMSYDALLEKARALLTERKARLRIERDEQALFSFHEIAASQGRVWRRIVSVAELRRLGRDLHNCLSGQCGNRYGYVQRLKEDVTQFWALYDETGAARAALAVESQNGRVSEARSFRNAPYVLAGPDFEALTAAGACQPPPPAPAQSDVYWALLESERAHGTRAPREDRADIAERARDFLEHFRLQVQMSRRAAPTGA